ncbi:MAG: tetratricopeptide repeat protein [Acidobacteriia bacterium]|nr:tetratricopeptide repeat protein [Terriglobia bacterium]
MTVSGTDARVEARRRLVALVSGNEDFDLLEACLLVAAEEFPGLDVAAEADRVDAMGRQARPGVAPLANFFARLDAMRTFLFDELGFRGNADQFDDPRNSFLNEVLNRRAGIPITLSILYVEVARRAGIEASGVALPGHFVVRVGDATRATFVDPFHGGHVITEDDCRELSAKTTGRASLFRQEMLLGASAPAILARLLHNLKRVYLAREDYSRAHAAVDRLLIVSPDDHSEIRDRGFLHAHLGRNGAAVADLEAYLSLAPRAPDAESVRGRLAWLARKTTEIS